MHWRDKIIKEIEWKFGQETSYVHLETPQLTVAVAHINSKMRTRTPGWTWKYRGKGSNGHVWQQAELKRYHRTGNRP